MMIVPAMWYIFTDLVTSMISNKSFYSLSSLLSLLINHDVYMYIHVYTVFIRIDATPRLVATLELIPHFMKSEAK